MLKSKGSNSSTIPKLLLDIENNVLEIEGVKKVKNDKTDLAKQNEHNDRIGKFSTRKQYVAKAQFHLIELKPLEKELKEHVDHELAKGTKDPFNSDFARRRVATRAWKISARKRHFDWDYLVLDYLDRLICFAEWVLIAFTHSNVWWAVQVSLLAISTLCFLGRNYRILTKVHEELGELTTYAKLTFLDLLRAAISGSNPFQISCLIIGWVFLPFQSAQAFSVMRVVRGFRVFYFETDVRPEHVEPHFNVKLLRFYFLRYLRSGKQEVTAAGLGGVPLLFMYFQVTFVFAGFFWSQTRHWHETQATPDWWVPDTNQTPCDTFEHCFITVCTACLWSCVTILFGWVV